MFTISAVLPVYNESAVIAETIRRTHETLSALELPEFEIILVNDGSHDNTADIAKELQQIHPELRVISHQYNRGYGAALRTGFDAAQKDATWLMDSDGQFDPAELSQFLPHYKAEAAVFGYRKNRQDNWMRRLNHWTFFGLVHLLFGTTTHDVNCAFKLFPSKLGKKLTANGAMISTELVLRARHNGYEVIEVPVHHYPRIAGTPTGANPRVVMRAFVELWKMWRQPTLIQTKN